MRKLEEWQKAKVNCYSYGASPIRWSKHFSFSQLAEDCNAIYSLSKELSAQVVYFAGSSGAGKTTLRNWFMSSDANPAASVAYAVSSPPKPTLGLDYTFIRRSNAIDW